ncbi:hypothetical protein, partial [Segatella oulorum]|uniref:hypothetical protein n=1 Tax=Segatella oulorum TaxID=28136 RepID=UPI0028F08D47
FSAPQGCKSKNNGFFLRRKLVRQKTMTFFCASESRWLKSPYGISILTTKKAVAHRRFASFY